MSEMEKKEPYCPFYLQDTRCSITCEGMMTNECMMHRFKNSREKEDWMDAACRSPKCARRCIAANMLESIYDCDASQPDSVWVRAHYGTPPTGKNRHRRSTRMAVKKALRAYLQRDGRCEAE